MWIVPLGTRVRTFVALGKIDVAPRPWEPGRRKRPCRACNPLQRPSPTSPHTPQRLQPTRRSSRPQVTKLTHGLRHIGQRLLAPRKLRIELRELSLQLPARATAVRVQLQNQATASPAPLLPQLRVARSVVSHEYYSTSPGSGSIPGTEVVGDVSDATSSTRAGVGVGVIGASTSSM